MMKDQEGQQQNYSQIFNTIQTTSQELKPSKATDGTQKKKYWSIPYSELEKLLSLFDGEKLNIDPVVWLDELEKELTARRYSPRTIKAYLHYNEDQ